MLSGNFQGSEIRHGIFVELIFCYFVGSPTDFFAIWFLLSFDHSRHLKSGVPPPLLGLMLHFSLLPQMESLLTDEVFVVEWLSYCGCSSKQFILSQSSLFISLNGSLFRRKQATGRVFPKISSCRVDTTSRRGIKHRGVSFGSNFLLFSNKSSPGPHS